MAHTHDHGSTVITERDSGPAAALIAVIAILVVAFLVWFFGFSGVVFDRDSGGSTTRIEQNVEEGGSQSGTTGGGGTAPSPASS